MIKAGDRVWVEGKVTGGLLWDDPHYRIEVGIDNVVMGRKSAEIFLTEEQLISADKMKRVGMGLRNACAVALGFISGLQWLDPHMGDPIKETLKSAILLADVLANGVEDANR